MYQRLQRSCTSHAQSENAKSMCANWISVDLAFLLCVWYKKFAISGILCHRAENNVRSPVNFRAFSYIDLSKFPVVGQCE